jgi:hypothetical protein
MLRSCIRWQRKRDVRAAPFTAQFAAAGWGDHHMGGIEVEEIKLVLKVELDAAKRTRDFAGSRTSRPAMRSELKRIPLTMNKL